MFAIAVTARGSVALFTSPSALNIPPMIAGITNEKVQINSTTPYSLQ